MKLHFNLEYQTTFGEELAVNILLDGKTEQHKMGTLDGCHWMCELSKTVKTNAHMDYYYSVMRTVFAYSVSGLILRSRAATHSVKAEE